MDAIVGGSASSRLFQEIREKRGMAYSVYSYSSQYADAGQIGVYVGTREDNLAECLEIAVAELSDLAAGNVRADELARAKENLKGRILLSLESTSARMTRLGKSTITDTPLLTPEAIVKRLEAVTAAEVAELADALLAAGPPVGRGDRARRESRSPRPFERVNPALLEKAAYAGRALRRRGEGRGAARARARRGRARGRRRVARCGPEGCDVAIDFTRPDAVDRERRARASRRAFPW